MKIFDRIKGKITQKILDKEVKDFEQQLRDQGFKFSIPAKERHGKIILGGKNE